ncbi:hypothetical protein JTB14_012026 [Gonioctena quinquepunctata]|nr:hypothetical protein JTB14_012026 [Gonioctena quinquepunctata]
MNHSSRKAWSLIKKLTNDPTGPKDRVDVTANQIAHQLLLNGKPRPKHQDGHHLQKSPNIGEWTIIYFSLAELDLAINSLKPRKSPGSDNIANEFLQNLGPPAKSWLIQLFNRCWAGKKPDIFLDCDDKIHDTIKLNIKQAYDFSKREEIKVTSSGALPELLIKNFDTEQIWQEVELQNASVLAKSLKSVSKLLIKKDTLIFSTLQNELNDIQTRGNEEENNSDSEPGSGLESDTGLQNGDNLEKPLNENEDSSEEKNDEELDLGDESEDETEKNTKQVGKKKKSEVEDDFFKLDEMENFLNSEEKKLNDPDSGNNSDDSQSEDESLDLFEDLDSDEEDKSKTARFKDFFRSNEEDKKVKRNKFLEDMSDNEQIQTKSALELREERLRKRIDEVVEFDLTSRPAPIITEKTTLQLEDIIRQRIKDKVFDSVIRKAKPIETPLEYKKKLVLNQEKSKHSLAQIYEKEYLEKQASIDPDTADKEEEEPEVHKEVKTLMRDLFNKLDALSNFHFTPKPAVPELRIVSNLPAITMEEVVPVTTSDAALLAPEEVRNRPKGDIIGKSERTKADKNRERRKKKLKQKAHLKNKQINKNMLGVKKIPKDNTFSKQSGKNKNIEKMDETLNAKSFKSSAAFFSQLQEQVQSHIKDKVQDKKRKKSKNHLEAKKVKL